MNRCMPFVLVAAMAAGCVPSREGSEEEIARAWYLADDPWPQAEPMRLDVGDRRLPSRWVFQYDESLIWATVRTVRAIDALEAGEVGDEIVFAIAPRHAELIAEELAGLRGSVERLRQIAEAAEADEPQAWADGLADALVEVEKISRVAAPEGDRSAGGDPGAWATGPIVQMLAGFLNDESNGRLLAELGRPSEGMLRPVLGQVVLRLGFAIANKQLSPGMVRSIVDAMGGAEDPDRLRGTLRRMLAGMLPAAAPASESDEIARMLDLGLRFTPPALRVLEAFVKQWKEMESLTVEFRRAGEETVAALTFRVKEGRSASISGLYFMQPELRFRRGCRVTILPEAPSTDETVVLFEPLDGGAAEVRFTGLGWALVRLLAVPIDNAAIRGVRVWSGETNPGLEATTVTLVMQATGAVEDPRRMIVFHRVKELAGPDRPEGPGREALRSVLSFSYLTPPRIYEYRHESTPDTASSR